MPITQARIPFICAVLLLVAQGNVARAGLVPATPWAAAPAGCEPTVAGGRVQIEGGHRPSCGRAQTQWFAAPGSGFPGSCTSRTREFERRPDRVVGNIMSKNTAVLRSYYYFLAQTDNKSVLWVKCNKISHNNFFQKYQITRKFCDSILFQLVRYLFLVTDKSLSSAI